MNNDVLKSIESYINQPRDPWWKGQEQWAMQAAYTDYDYSLMEYHPDQPVVAEPEEVSTVELSAIDKPTADEVASLIQTMLANIQKPTSAVPSDISAALNGLLGANKEIKAKAQKNMYEGAVLRTIAYAGDMFNQIVGISAGAINNINNRYSIAKQNYENEMESLDNQVLYIKHQLADRFNKTIETNIMNMAAKNLRVTSGNVLETTKDMAQEMTEDIREAESNAELKKLALRAGKDQAKESTRYAEKQTWTNLIGSAVKLGLAVETGGGTNETWGDLYSGYKTYKATKTGSLNTLYKG